MSAADEARKVMEDYFAAFNAQDEEAIRQHFHFPFSWIINSRVMPVAAAADFQSPTKTLVETEGWHHSVFDYIEPVQVWENKVHFKLAYSRYKADGTKYVTHEALWILTKISGRWGICLISLNVPKTAS